MNNIQNINLVAFAISKQGRLVKFDTILMLLIYSLVWIYSAACLPLTPPGLNIWKLLTVKKHSLEI